MKLRLLASFLLLVATAFAQTTDWTAVETALGRKGSLQPGNVYKFGLPRTDLDVSVGTVKIAPSLALGGWVAFLGSGEECIVMGDLVVTENEVPAVVAAALKNDIAVTAIHNHVLNESPRIMYMHVGGHFTSPPHTVCVVSVAHNMKNVLAATHIPAAAPAPAPAPPAANQAPDAFQAGIEKAMSAQAKMNGGVLQFSIPRPAAVAMHGMSVPPAMGTATGINFQPIGGNRAAVTGDFVMTGNEVPKVMKALSDGGIEPTALHSHMIDEEPRLFFMHFWAVDDAVKLATTLRHALDQIGSSSSNIPAPTGLTITPH